MRWGMWPAALAIFFLIYPVAIKNWHGASYILSRGYKLHLKFLERFAGEPNLFIISDRPGMFTVHNWGACSFAYANREKGTILTQFKRHLITKIIVMQEMDYATGQPTKDTALDKEYRLKTLWEVQNDAQTYLRYSECE